MMVAPATWWKGCDFALVAADFVCCCLAVSWQAHKLTPVHSAVVQSCLSPAIPHSLLPNITSSTLLSFLKTFATKVAFRLKPSLHHQCQHPAPNRLSRQDPNLCWMANQKEKWDKTTLCWQKSTFLHQIQQVPASGLSDGSSKDPGRGEHVETSLRHPMLWENMSKISCHQTAFNKEGKSVARRDYLTQAESNSTWKCADCTVW